jgi:hypothetical protein
MILTLIILVEGLSHDRTAGSCHKRTAGKRNTHREEDHGVIANATPHKFAWYAGDPADYPKKLMGKTIVGAEYFGNHVEIKADELRVVINTPMRYHIRGEEKPKRHRR